MSTDTPILLDTDFVSSFAWVGRMDIIEGRYSGRMVVLEEVMTELDRVPHLASCVRQSVAKGHIREEVMLVDSPEALEFARLHDTGRYGSGEASCMTYLSYHEGILASNNLADVKAFCNHRGVTLLTTADVLLQAYDEGTLPIDETDGLWRGMLARKRKLPAPSFSEYLSAVKKSGSDWKSE